LQTREHVLLARRNKRKAVNPKKAPKLKKKKPEPADSDTDSVESVTPPTKKPTGILRSPASQSSLSVDTTTSPPTTPLGRPKEPQRHVINPTNEMDWVLYDTPVPLHVWVAQRSLKRVKFAEHVKFKIDTTSSLDSLDDLYQLLQDECNKESWDITADQEGFKLYYRDQRYRGIQSTGAPLPSIEDYRKSLNEYSHQTWNQDATASKGYTLDLLVKIKDKPKPRRTRKESTVGGEGGDEFLPQSLGRPPKKTRDDLDCDFEIKLLGPVVKRVTKKKEEYYESESKKANQGVLAFDQEGLTENIRFGEFYDRVVEAALQLQAYKDEEGTPLSFKNSRLYYMVDGRTKGLEKFPTTTMGMWLFFRKKLNGKSLAVKTIQLSVSLGKVHETQEENLDTEYSSAELLQRDPGDWCTPVRDVSLSNTDLRLSTNSFFVQAKAFARKVLMYPGSPLYHSMTMSAEEAFVAELTHGANRSKADG
jgi:hypothetical protein